MWGNLLPWQIGQRIAQDCRHRTHQAPCPYRCMVLPQSGFFPPILDFSLPFLPGCRHSPRAFMCSCSSSRQPEVLFVFHPLVHRDLQHQKTTQKQNTNRSLWKCTKCAVRSVPKGSNILPLIVGVSRLFISTIIIIFLFVPLEQGFPILNFSSGESPDHCLKSIHCLKEMGFHSLF